MNANPLIEQFLQERLGGDPQMQALITMMQQQQTEAVEINAARPAPSEHELERARRCIQKLRRHIARLEAHIARLEAADSEMAHALGACVQCWGEDSECRHCRGRGMPGGLPPDEALFEQLVMPAVRRMKPLEK